MRVQLFWNDPNYGEEEHRIYRSDSPMDPEALPTALATVPANATSFIDDDSLLVEGETYFYRVSAVHQGQEYISSELEVLFEIEDPLFDQVVLLLPFDTIPGGGSSLIVDLSWYSHVIENFGALLTGSPAKYGESGNFTPSGNNIRIQVAPDPILEISGDFTLEFWAHRPASSTSDYGRIFDAGESTYQSGAFSVWHTGGDFGSHVEGEIALTPSGQYLVGTRFNHNDDQWHHVAFCRSGSTIRCFLDGVQTASATNSTEFTRFAQEGFCIGRAGDARSSSAFKGHLDDFRLTKAARYTSNFTPEGPHPIPAQLLE